MTKGKHTPGPWKHLKRGGAGNLIYGPTGYKRYESDDGYSPLATVQDCLPPRSGISESANQQANIDLIAAAPSMYEALEALAFEVTVSAAGPRAKAIIENPDSQIGGALAKARAALSLARGEKP